MDDIFKKILCSNVYDIALKTPLDYAEKISVNLNNEVFLKREDLQPVFSFKIRGAYNKISHLTDEEKKKGIICASAGNHAQGVALSAQKLGIDATIVMPITTPLIKIDAVKNYGGEVVLAGDNYSEASDYCMELAKKKGSIYIHPFDDPYVIAGQGTIALELMQDCSDMDAVFVPIGGGGLIAGIACYLKEIRPEIKIIGVEAEESAAMMASKVAGKNTALNEVGIFADGVAVKKIGELNYDYIVKYVDAFISVSTDEICSAIKDVYEDTRTILEPGGALALAGLKKYVSENSWENQKVVVINSGANMNFQRLQFVAERTLTGEKKEAIYGIRLKEDAGILTDLCQKVIQGKGITEFNYRKSSQNEAYIFVGVSINSPEDKTAFSDLLKKEKFSYEDLTDNELAKLHVRHMVGGKSKEAKNEVLYHFEFPERPSALDDFLTKMSGRWNISLFHYRSHGADFGRVLIGLEVPDQEKASFQKFLSELHYPFIDESENVVYKMFLGNGEN